MYNKGSNMASDWSKHILCVQNLVSTFCVTFSATVGELQLWWIVIMCQMCTLDYTSILCASSSMRIDHSPLSNGRM